MKTQKKLIPPHLGNLLKTYYKTNRINKSGLARVMNRSRATVQDYEERKSLQCNVLWDICVAVEHNFFADLAAQLPQTYTTNVPEDTTQAQRIAQLEEENRILKTKVDTLLAVVGKG
jgi:hypothetical protein